MCALIQIVTCMKTHEDELNPECKAHVDEAFADFADFHSSCDVSLTAQGCAINDPKVYGKCVVEHLPDMSKDW